MCPSAVSLPDFFFNNKVIVDIVRKIQFLVEVHVPEGLLLGRKSVADRVAHSWHGGQLPRKPALLRRAALPFPAASLFFSKQDQERLMLLVPYPPSKSQGCCMEQCQRKTADEPHRPSVKLPHPPPICRAILWSYTHHSLNLSVLWQQELGSHHEYQTSCGIHRWWQTARLNGLNKILVKGGYWLLHDKGWCEDGHF